MQLLYKPKLSSITTNSSLSATKVTSLMFRSQTFKQRGPSSNPLFLSIFINWYHGATVTKLPDANPPFCLDL